MVFLDFSGFLHFLQFLQIPALNAGLFDCFPILGGFFYIPGGVFAVLCVFTSPEVFFSVLCVFTSPVVFSRPGCGVWAKV